ncbi:MAG TPA: hypothetical protein VHB99_13550 [Pirellulales bacterium]|nr:hypothetical protein [Pirellulales bacterium]
MLRILPVCHAPWRRPCWSTSLGERSWSQSAVQPTATPWQAEGARPRNFEAVENRNALIDIDYYWTDRPPLENLSSSLTIQNALLQRQLLLQSGVGYEHVGILVRFQVYSAKGASLPAVMPAVWATPEFAERVQRQHELLKAPLVGQATARVDLSA